MGVYFNPENESFQRARNSSIFIDKTALLDFLNKRISTENNCIAVSHARRFGKSHAAGMVDAYYSLGSESSKLFDDTDIAKSEDYRKHMNKYNVIHLDVSSAWDFHKMDFESTKAWYNGYLIDGKHMYNPNSVVQSMLDKDFDSYWKNTSSFASINTFITMNYEGLKDDIMTMMAGGEVRVKTANFKNDFSTIASKDDALTALIHLGYLGYDAERKKAFIPNYEVATALLQYCS